MRTRPPIPDRQPKLSDAYDKYQHKIGHKPDMNSFEQKVKNALYPFLLDKCRRGRGYLQNGMQNQVKVRVLLVYFSLVVYWNTLAILLWSTSVRVQNTIDTSFDVIAYSIQVLGYPHCNQACIS